jgi:hypothetical protein
MGDYFLVLAFAWPPELDKNDPDTIMATMMRPLRNGTFGVPRTG